jgi:hypothetical protein
MNYMVWQKNKLHVCLIFVSYSKLSQSICGWLFIDFQNKISQWKIGHPAIGPFIITDYDYDAPFDEYIEQDLHYIHHLYLSFYLFADFS